MTSIIRQSQIYIFVIHFFILTIFGQIVAQEGSHYTKDQQYILIDDMLIRRNQLLKYSETGAAVWKADPPWTDGKVYYSFDPELSQTTRELCLQSFREWEEGTPLQFIPHTDQPNYLYIEYHETSFSNIGMGGGRQILAITWNDPKGTILHELGHAIGLHHEHQRSDRDLYIDVFPENAVEWYRNFIEMKLPTLNYTPYDFFSIMHYGRNTLSKNGEDTIQPKDGYKYLINVIGQRDSLSYLDKAGVRKLYSHMPYLVFPYNKGHSVTVHNLELQWSTFPDVLQYQVQIAKDSAFLQLVDEQFLPNKNENRDAIEIQTATIKKLDLATKYYWRVRCEIVSGFKSWSDINKFYTVWTRPTIYIDHQEIPGNDYSLLQNYPNPFNSETNFTFDLPKTEMVNLVIYNSIGELVSTLLSKKLPKGRYTINWEAKDFTSGLYFYRLEAGANNFIKNMLLIK